jgi:hypothetical protein
MGGRGSYRAIDASLTASFEAHQQQRETASSTDFPAVGRASPLRRSCPRNGKVAFTHRTSRPVNGCRRTRCAGLHEFANSKGLFAVEVQRPCGSGNII